MGHSVQALIGKQESLEQVCKLTGYEKVVSLPQDFFLMPLSDKFLAAIVGPNKSELVDPKFMKLDSKLGQLILDSSFEGGLVYFETNYFGGKGEQMAVYANGGQPVVDKNYGDGSINKALKMLGVHAHDGRDEFDELCLGWFRSNDDWIEQPRFGTQPDLADYIKVNRKLRRQNIQENKPLKKQFFDDVMTISYMYSLAIFFLLIAYVVYQLYGQAVASSNLILFVTLNVMVLMTLIHCIKSVMQKTMSKSDMMGNVLTFALVVYLGIFFVLKLLPNLNSDVYIMNAFDL